MVFNDQAPGRGTNTDNAGRTDLQVNCVYLCACGCPVFQLWTSLKPPATSVSLQHSQLGHRNAARRGLSTPDVSDLLDGLKRKEILTGFDGCVYPCIPRANTSEVYEGNHQSNILNSGPTFNVTHGHLDGSFASFTNVILAVIIRDDSIL